ncbi:MAG: T9SS type A sorting domain-containing protein, partial [Flavobacteriales bacterium]
TVREKALNPATATQTISTQGLVSGLYIIQLKSGNQVFTKKIVVH